MTSLRTIAACNASVHAEPAQIAAAFERRQTIKSAANEFRRMWRFSAGTIQTAFPPMAELEAYQARRDAYNFSIMVGPRQMYRDEVAAINAAEVVL